MARPCGRALHNAGRRGRGGRGGAHRRAIMASRPEPAPTSSAVTRVAPAPRRNATARAIAPSYAALRWRRAPVSHRVGSGQPRAQHPGGPGRGPSAGWTWQRRRRAARRGAAHAGSRERGGGARAGRGPRLLVQDHVEVPARHDCVARAACGRLRRKVQLTRVPAHAHAHQLFLRPA